MKRVNNPDDIGGKIKLIRILLEQVEYKLAEERTEQHQLIESYRQVAGK